MAIYSSQSQYSAELHTIIYPNFEFVFANTIFDMFLKREHADLIFICKSGVKVYTHKCLVISVSKFFWQLISSSDEDVIYVSLPGVDQKQLENVFKLIYEGVLKVNLYDMISMKEIISLLDFQMSNSEVCPMMSENINIATEDSNETALECKNYAFVKKNPFGSSPNLTSNLSCLAEVSQEDLSGNHSDLKVDPLVEPPQAIEPISEAPGNLNVLKSLSSTESTSVKTELNINVSDMETSNSSQSTESSHEANPSFKRSWKYYRSLLSEGESPPTHDIVKRTRKRKRKTTENNESCSGNFDASVANVADPISAFEKDPLLSSSSATAQSSCSVVKPEGAASVINSTVVGSVDVTPESELCSTTNSMEDYSNSAVGATNNGINNVEKQKKKKNNKKKKKENKKGSVESSEITQSPCGVLYSGHQETNSKNVQENCLPKCEKCKGSLRFNEFITNELSKDSYNISSYICDNCENSSDADKISCVNGVPVKNFINNVDVLNETLSSSDSERRFHCATCNRVFCKPLAFTKHLMTHTTSKDILNHTSTKDFGLGSREKISCPACTKVFVKQVSFKKHLKTHALSDEMLNHMSPKSDAFERFYCAACDGVFCGHLAFTKHVLTHATSRDTLNSVSSLDNECKFHCPPCNKVFSNQMSFTKHIVTHANMKKFSCVACGIMFYKRKELSNHLQIHKNQRVYCKQCNKSFSCVWKLSNHSLVHGTVKKYRCDLCDRSFFQKESLKDHLVTHTDMKPHMCHLCDKTFFRKFDLTMHMYIHGNLRQYSCLLCRKAFKQKTVLRSHMLVHSEEKPFKCALCYKQYYRRHNLRRHLLAHNKLGDISSIVSV